MPPKLKPPAKRKSQMQLTVEFIHTQWLAKKVYSEPHCYGGLKVLFQRLGPVKVKKLEYYYTHAYGLSLRVAIQRRFVRYPAYAKKLNALLQGKNPKAAPKEFWPARSRQFAAKRLENPSSWPSKLPRNILIYKTSGSMYRPFRSWGRWYLLNYDVLQGGAMAKAGIHIPKPRSPFPDSVSDPDYGDLEFFKDLHEIMNRVFRTYNQACDKGIWDVTGNQEIQRSKGRVARRCLPRAQRLEALFKAANKGEAGRNMLQRLQGEIAKLKGWKSQYGHLVQ